MENQLSSKFHCLISIPLAPLRKCSDVGHKLECSQEECLVGVDQDTLVGNDLRVKENGKTAKLDSSVRTE